MENSLVSSKNKFTILKPAESQLPTAAGTHGHSKASLKRPAPLAVEEEKAPVQNDEPDWSPFGRGRNAAFEPPAMDVHPALAGKITLQATHIEEPEE